MASALKLLRRDGYRKVRLEDVAEDAGVSKATIYHYFANKDELLTRTVAARMAMRHTAIERRLATTGGSAAARLRAFLRELWNIALTRQSALWQRLLVSEIAVEAPEVFAAWAHGLVQRWSFIEELVREGQQTGEFSREVDAHVAARMIVSSLTDQALFHVHFGLRRFAPCRTDRLFDEAVNLLLRGLRSARPQEPEG